MPTMTLTTGEATQALVDFITECELDTLAAIFEDVFGCARKGTCLADVPEGGDATADGTITFEIDTEMCPGETEAQIRQGLALPPR